MKEIVIEANNVCINYRIMKNVTVRHNLFQKRSCEQVFEAVKNVSFTVEKGGYLVLLEEMAVGSQPYFVLLQEYFRQIVVVLI